MKKTLLLLAFIPALFAQTSPYPGGLDTNTTLFVSGDNVLSTLAQAMTPTNNVAFVADGTGFVPNMLVTVCDATNTLGACTSWENMLITSVTGQALTVLRGQAGTTAQAHAVNKPIGALIDAAHQTSLKSAVIAIETTLGTNPFPLSVIKGGTGATTAAGGLQNLLTGSAQGTITNKVQMAGVNSGTAGVPLCNDAAGNATTSGCSSVLPSGMQFQYLRIQPNTGNNTTLQFASPIIANASDYSFPTQTPGGTLSAGSAVISMSPCPAGMNSFAVNNSYVYLTAGSGGTAEPALVTGGTCTSGSTNGTLIVTVGHSHGSGWTIGPASFGWQEAMNGACAAGGGTVVLPAGVLTLNGTVTVPCSNITVRGAGGLCCGLGTFIQRTGNFGNSLNLGSSAAAVNGINLFDFAISQQINYVQGAPGVCGTISNRPTSGTNIEAWGPNSVNIQRVRLENMPVDFETHGGVNIVLRDVQIYGLWDANCPADQVTQTGVKVVKDASGAGASIPTYILLDDVTGLGYLSSMAFNGAGPRQYVQIDSCERCQVINSYFGGSSGNNILVNANGSNISSEIDISHNMFDSALTADVQYQSDGSQLSSHDLLSGNMFNGELVGSTAVSVTDHGSGVQSTYGLEVSHNTFSAYLSTPIVLMAAYDTVMSGNQIKGYNANNGFSTPATASGVYFGGRSNLAGGSGNVIGGGIFGEAYPTAHTLYGLYAQDPVVAQNSINVGWAPPANNSLANYAPTVSSCGTSPSVAASSTSQQGTVTTGTGTFSNCTVNFVVPFTHQPACIVNAVGGGAPPAIATGATSVIISTSTTSASYSWSCQ